MKFWHQLAVPLLSREVDLVIMMEWNWELTDLHY